MSSDEPLRLVLDSGATSCRYVLYCDPFIPLAEGVLKGLNYTEEGAQGINRLFKELTQILTVNNNPDVLGIALAGAGREDIYRQVRRDLERFRPQGWGEGGVFLFHDGEAALWASLGSGAGVVTAAGTGSIAFGRDCRGRALRAGGWGRLAGDEGSAHWIGLRAVQFALRAFDGREVSTRLEGLLRNELDLEETQELVAWIHHPERSKEEIAALAPLVEEAADEKDVLALRILEDAASELAGLTTALLRRGAFSGAVKVGTTGSVFQKNRRIWNSFSSIIADEYPDAEIQPPRGDNLEGAVGLTESLISESDQERISSYSS